MLYDGGVSVAVDSWCVVLEKNLKLDLRVSQPRLANFKMY